MKMDPFIEAEEVAGHSLKHCCDMFEVSRAAYYQRRQAVPSKRAVTDVELTEKIKAIHAESARVVAVSEAHWHMDDFRCVNRLARSAHPARVGGNALD